MNYCLHEDGRPLQANEPEPEKKVRGIIRARLIRDEEDGAVLVAVPDGQVLRVSDKEIKQVREHASA